MTTASNIAKLQQGMVFEELPATFQHAIVITWTLGIQYLWIDAICIIQDDTRDWELESGRMASIYGNSYLTISATSSLSPAAGLVQMREPAKMFEHRDDDNERFSVFVRPLLEHNFLGSNVWASDRYPTLGRAWCFQERYLSRRVVHFLQEEMAWECGEQRRCQCGGWQYRPEQAKEQLRDIISKLHITQGSRFTLDDLPKEELRDILVGWGIVLDDFCRATLTYETDTLPALSGIAKLVQNAGLGTYLAGLWRFRLEDQLMWCARDGYGKKPAFYTAPTFSPLSRVGNVSLAIIYSDEPLRIHARILEAVCNPKGLDETGAVVSGHINLQAPLVRTQVASSIVITPDPYCCYIECFVDSGGRFQVSWVPDTCEIPGSIQPGDGLYLLRFRDDDLLVLTQDLTNGDSFIRVGVCFSQPNCDVLFASGRETVVRII
jgi:hypothetical protein